MSSITTVNGENGSAKANQAANGPSATGEAENEDDDSDKEDENGAPEAGATGGRIHVSLLIELV